MKTTRVIPPSSPFRIVDESDVADVLFGGSKGRVSLYLQALQGLLTKPGKVLEVDSPTARAGIYAQAKKHGIAILFGESRGKLYVKVIAKAGPEEFVLALLKDAPLTAVEIDVALGEKHPGAEFRTVVGPLSQSDKIILRTIAGVKKWQLA